MSILSSIKNWFEKVLFIQEDDDEFPNSYLYAFEFLIQHEGGFVNHARDRGGATKYGLTQNWINALLKQKDEQTLVIRSVLGLTNADNIHANRIKLISKDQAKQIYYELWWKMYHFDLIESDLIAIKLFDISVNIGPDTAILKLQNILNKSFKHSLRLDGVIGIKTASAVARTNEKQLYGAYKSELISYYFDVVHSNPRQEQFLQGWLNRAQDDPFPVEINQEC